VIFNFETKGFSMTGTNVKAFNSMSFEILKDVIDWDLFSSNFCEGMKGDISIERMISFSPSNNLIEMKLFPYWMIAKNEIGFIMKEQEKEIDREEAEFSMDNENENIDSQMKFFCEILQLSGGSSSGSNFNVRDLKSNGCFEIDGSVKNIESRDFFHWESLKAIIFRSDSHLKKN
jgi:hypothetical protein